MSWATPDDYGQIFFEMNGESSSASNYRLWSKYTIYAVNIIYMVVGALVLSTGVWLRTDSRFRDFLSERYRQAVHEAFWEAPTLYAFSYIMIVLGVVLLLLAMFGCCGVTGAAPNSAPSHRRSAKRRQQPQSQQHHWPPPMHRRRNGGDDGGGQIAATASAAVRTSRPLLWLYTVGTGGLLMFTIGCGCYILYTKDGIDVELSDALNYMVQHYYQGPGIVQETLDRLQQAFRCCGNAGCSDFRAFRQDPPRTCDLRCDGCHYRIWLALRIGFSVALAIFGIVILAQMVGILVSLILLCTTEVDDDYDDGNAYDCGGFDGGDYGWSKATAQQRWHHGQPPRHYQGANGHGHGMRSLGRAANSTHEFSGKMCALSGHNGGAATVTPSSRRWHHSDQLASAQRPSWDGQQQHHFLHSVPSSFHYY